MSLTSPWGFYGEAARTKAVPAEHQAELRRLRRSQDGILLDLRAGIKPREGIMRVYVCPVY